MEQEKKDVSYIVFEGEMARAERRDKRQWIIIIVLIATILINNIGWLIYENSFDTYSYSQDGNGQNNMNAGEQGDVFYGPAAESPQEKER